MDATVLPCPLVGRTADVLDLAIAEGILMQHFGPDAGMLQVLSRSAERVVVEFSSAARAALCELALVVEPEDLEGWVGLIAPLLVWETVGLVGEDWQAEAELGVELALAERSEEVALIGALPVGPVVFDATRSCAELTVPVVLDPGLAAIVA